MRALAAVGAALMPISVLGLASQPVVAEETPVPPALGSAPVAPPPPSPPGSARLPIPTGNPATWVTTNDYPVVALRNHQEGTTSFRVGISPQGRVSTCTIVHSSGSPSLDAATCALITQRAVFRPALDKHGKVTASTYTNRVRWIIPEGPPVPIQIKPELAEVSFVIEVDGSASNCVKTVNGLRSYDLGPNDPCSSGVKFAPFTDAQGRAVRKRVTYTTSLKVTDPPR